MKDQEQQFTPQQSGNPFRANATDRGPVLTGQQALEAMGGTFLIPAPGNSTGDTFTAAHSARISAMAQAEKAERLQGELTSLLERCRQAVIEAREAGLFVVDVSVTEHRPELRLVLCRALAARGFWVQCADDGTITLGWRPAPTPRPPVHLIGQDWWDLTAGTDPLSRSGPPNPVIGAEGLRHLLRETPEEVG